MADASSIVAQHKDCFMGNNIGSLDKVQPIVTQHIDINFSSAISSSGHY